MRALNEVEFALPDGSVGRIDRLVEMPEEYWVLDYKSGGPSEELLESYRTQVVRYRAAVMAILPGKPVRCRLIFGEGDSLEI
ncbi:MAG: PD-(D/E)XK nuclease family protein [Rhodocyclaceae bacterium]|nr:PD-(D/E)XK nuclease family protein [Rhodocyclaceae bacterium]